MKRRTRLSWSRGLALSVLAACSHSDHGTPAAGAPAITTSTGGPADATRVANWREDLRVLASTIATKHKNPFFHLPKAEWDNAVAELDREIPTLDDAHILVRLGRLVASLGDGHTMIRVAGYLGVYPLHLTWFDDGIYVTGAADRSLVGKRLVGIGGHPIADVIAALGPLVSRDNDAWLHAELPSLIIDRELLAGSDLASADRASFQLAGADGALQVLELAPAPRRVQITTPTPLPLHLQGPPGDYKYWNKYAESDHLLYFAYNECAEDPRVGTFASFVEQTMAFATQHRVDRFVIDLRGNSGGNSEVIRPLVDALAGRRALAGRVFAIIGMHTFSSAVMAAMDLKRQPLRARLVGGPTGGKPSSYGDIQTFMLPHSRLPGQYSTKRFESPDFPGDSVMPDLPVVVKSADWFAGRDPAMDAILAAPVPAP